MSRSAILDDCAAGVLSPQIALSRLVLAGEAIDAAQLGRETEAYGGSPALEALAELAARQADRLPALQRLAQSGLSPDGEDVVRETARLFDRLAAEAPEAGVAFYSLGDPAMLDEATAELVAVIRGWAPTQGRRVLDFGCGIGRLGLALGDAAADVLGLDVSAGMVAEARRRAAGRANLRFAIANGEDLAPLPDASVDLLIAADSLPYVVRAGKAERFVEEAARVLVPGGDLLVFNWSYRGAPERDRAEAAALAQRFGFAALRLDERPFRIWDASAFHLRRL